jgi:hypothetical protein
MQGSVGETVKPAKSGLAKICANSAGISPCRSAIPLPIAEYCWKNGVLRGVRLRPLKFRLTSGLPIPAESRRQGVSACRKAAPRRNTPTLSAAVERGKLKIVGGIYHLGDGKVELIG